MTCEWCDPPRPLRNDAEERVCRDCGERLCRECLIGNQCFSCWNLDQLEPEGGAGDGTGDGERENQ